MQSRILSVLVRLLALAIIASGCSSLPEAPGISSDTLVNIENQYGVAARERVQQWRYLIEEHKTKPDQTRLQAANQLFNQLTYEEDDIHWHKPDYWATPIETLASNGGDCEDFVIGKYFTLREMGIADQCLRLTYVKALGKNTPHMVLNYQCERSAENLVLDNITQYIMPSSERTDLLPVYSFNAGKMWLAKQQGVGEDLGSSDRMSLWTNLLQRIDQQAATSDR